MNQQFETEYAWWAVSPPTQDHGVLQFPQQVEPQAALEHQPQLSLRRTTFPEPRKKNEQDEFSS